VKWRKDCADKRIDGVKRGIRNEDEVRKFIKEEAQKYADSITEDSMGNLICYKKADPQNTA